MEVVVPNFRARVGGTRQIEQAKFCVLDFLWRHFLQVDAIDARVLNPEIRQDRGEPRLLDALLALTDILP
eukprot:5163050-Prymnesium_polylepis.1